MAILKFTRHSRCESTWGESHFITRNRATDRPSENKNKMAGNEEPKQVSASIPLPSPSPSPSRAKMEEQTQRQPEGTCWRKQVDQNLKRLHSLLFGADLALERCDPLAARIFGLRLLGFLDSQCRSDLDEAFIYPIRREAAAKVDAARRSLVPKSDRYRYSLSLVI